MICTVEFGAPVGFTKTKMFSRDLKHILLAIVLAGCGTLFAALPGDTHEPRVIVNMGTTRGLVFSPTPEYPGEALKKHWGGSGLFELQFRRDGLASAVFVTLSTGHKVLADSVTAPSDSGALGKVIGSSSRSPRRRRILRF